MKLFTSIFLLAILVISCKEKTKPASGSANSTPTADSVSTYLPVQELVQADIRQVDSFAGGILKKTFRDGIQQDSVFVDRTAFYQAAGAFFSPDLDSARFRQLFIESSLMDETTQLLNFIYTSKDNQQPLRKVVVYIAPSLGVDKPNRIYLEKEFQQGDTLVRQKLTWKMQQYFYILTVKEPATGTGSAYMEKFLWDPQTFAD